MCGRQKSSSVLGAAAIAKSFHVGRSCIALRGGGGGTDGLVVEPTMVFIGGTGTGSTNAAAVRQLKGARKQLFQQMLMVGGCGLDGEHIVEANETGLVAHRSARFSRLSVDPGGGTRACCRYFFFGERQDAHWVVEAAFVGRSFFKQAVEKNWTSARRRRFKVKLG